MNKNIGELVGTVIVEKERIVIDRVSYNVVKLHRPTKSGSTHAVVDLVGDAVMLLSADSEGKWLVDEKITSGNVAGFFIDWR